MRTISCLAGLLVLAAVARPAAAEIVVSKKYPREGETVTVTVTRPDGSPAPGAVVTATFRPGSSVPHERPAGTADATGILSWTPEEAGLVTLSAEIPPGPGEDEPTVQSRNLSVVYRGLPLQGLAVMLVAGAILYGGVIRGFATLNQAPPRMPDT